MLREVHGLKVPLVFSVRLEKLLVRDTNLIIFINRRSGRVFEGEKRIRKEEEGKVVAAEVKVGAG